MISARPFLSVDVNSNKQTATPTVTNNINVIQSNKETTKTANDNTPIPEVLVQPTEADDYLINSYNTLHEEYVLMKRERDALALILHINKSNPLIINSYIIASADDLKELIRILTGADNVEINADEFFTGCLTQKKYRKIISIFVTINGVTDNFKYGYGSANKLLNDEKISTKYIC